MQQVYNISLDFFQQLWLRVDQDWVDVTEIEENPPLKDGDLIIWGSAIANIIMESQPREIQRYVTPEGKIPFDQWYESLRNAKTQYKIDARLERIALGNLGDYRSIGEGVYEFRINYGPGYRIYFGQIGLKIVLLLLGGDKSTQKQDIRQAQEYWKDYDKRENTDL